MKVTNHNKRSPFAHRFHDITLTSVLCALIESAGLFPRRESHMAIFPSTEQEAKTSASVGLHCTEDIDDKKLIKT